MNKGGVIAEKPFDSINFSLSILRISLLLYFEQVVDINILQPIH